VAIITLSGENNKTVALCLRRVVI